MNAILLAGALFGTLAAVVAATPDSVEFASVDDRGSITRDVSVNPQTGQTEEVSVIGFID